MALAGGRGQADIDADRAHLPAARVVRGDARANVVSAHRCRRDVESALAGIVARGRAGLALADNDPDLGRADSQEGVGCVRSRCAILQPGALAVAKARRDVEGNVGRKLERAGDDDVGVARGVAALADYGNLAGGVGCGRQPDGYKCQQRERCQPAILRRHRCHPSFGRLRNRRTCLCCRS